LFYCLFVCFFLACFFLCVFLSLCVTSLASRSYVGGLLRRKKEEEGD
jgi:hypothetical protein